jgi:polyphosphate glucokinase
MEVLGIDVGGSGIKGAIVNLKSGKLATDRIRYPTPQPATPSSVSRTIAKITSELDWNGPIGVGFPAVIKKNLALNAANISDSWIGIDAVKVISKATGCKVTVLNDADAAGLAECAYGKRKINQGLVVFVTVGTGLGTALLYDGVLIPNIELGNVYLKKLGYGEQYAANSARERNHLSWKKWAKRFNRYLEELDNLLYPDEFVIGGGVSNTPELFVKYLKLKTPVSMATLKNEAGIVGAALAAYSDVRKKANG